MEWGHLNLMKTSGVLSINLKAEFIPDLVKLLPFASNRLGSGGKTAL